MNPWTLGALGLLSCLVPCGICTFKGSPMQRLIALEMTGIVVAMLLVVLAEVVGRSTMYDIALAAAFLCFGGGLVFARFLERWL